VAGWYRRRRPVLAAAAAVAVVAVIAVIISAAAGGRSASARGRSAGPPAAVPVVYSRVAGWHEGQVRPAAIYVGEGGAPYVSALHWSGWAAAGARASGYLHMQVPGCTLPSYRCPQVTVRVTVRLGEVRIHDGSAYFSRMRWTYLRDQRPHAISWRTDRGFWRG
jgi:hypothetical protein